MNLKGNEYHPGKKIYWNRVIFRFQTVDGLEVRIVYVKAASCREALPRARKILLKWLARRPTTGIYLDAIIGIG